MGLSETLLIAVVGMVLVFGAIALFWLLIGALVRLTGSGKAAAERPAADDGAGRDARRKAAAVAVAAALADREALAEPQPFPLPPTALVSTWQSVMRARQLSKRRTVR